MATAKHGPCRAATVFFITIVTTTIATMKQFRIDAYVLDTLMPDLVLHDRQPSAFLVYLQLCYRSSGKRGAVQVSHQEMAHATGLSKSAVQGAMRTLARRRLI